MTSTASLRLAGRTEVRPKSLYKGELMESTLMYRELHMYMFSERQSPEAIVAALKGVDKG